MQLCVTATHLSRARPHYHSTPAVGARRRMFRRAECYAPRPLTPHNSRRRHPRRCVSRFFFAFALQMYSMIRRAVCNYASQPLTSHASVLTGGPSGMSSMEHVSQGVVKRERAHAWIPHNSSLPAATLPATLFRQREGRSFILGNPLPTRTTEGTSTVHSVP